MRHVRCRVCGKNRKRRATSTYTRCEKCWEPVCNGCSVTVQVPRYNVEKRKWDRTPPEMRDVTRCRFCMAEEVLST